MLDFTYPNVHYTDVKMFNDTMKYYLPFQYTSHLSVEKQHETPADNRLAGTWFGVHTCKMKCISNVTCANFSAHLPQCNIHVNSDTANLHFLPQNCSLYSSTPTVCDNITLSYRFYETKRKRNDLFRCTKHPTHLDEMNGRF